MHKVEANTIYGKNFEEENFHIWSGKWYTANQQGHDSWEKIRS